MRSRELEKIREALNPQNLKLETLKDSPKVEDIRYTVGEDQGGDPSIFVTVILPDSTRSADWVAAKLDPIKERMQRSLDDAEVERWLYVRFVRAEDVREAEENAA